MMGPEADYQFELRRIQGEINRRDAGPMLGMIMFVVGVVLVICFGGCATSVQKQPTPAPVTNVTNTTVKKTNVNVGVPVLVRTPTAYPVYPVVVSPAPVVVVQPGPVVVAPHCDPPHHDEPHHEPPHDHPHH